MKMARVKPIELHKAVVLVTGAGSGIGRATSLEFADQGAWVLCADIHSDEAEKTAAACLEVGARNATPYTVDVANRLAMRALADEIHAQHGPLGVVVNNAGVGMTGNFADMTLEDWDWIRSINLDGVVNGCSLFGIPMLEKRHGRVINLSSGLGYVPTATEVGYVTTKAGVLALSQCLRADWRRHGIGVTAICPGVINTPIIDSTRFLGRQATPARRKLAVTAFRRGHKPETVAKVIVDATQRNRAVVPVGFESWAGWYLHRFGPVALQQFIAGGGPR